mmetsp:Transcript_35873/g.84336  ORF Transcript_35873/g.84336 Transcript_35873/m.84336 type:complete len:286 (+) Transcript_35873:92-949(+)
MSGTSRIADGAPGGAQAADGAPAADGVVGGNIALSVWPQTGADARAKRQAVEVQLLKDEVASHVLVASTVTASKQWEQTRAVNNDRTFQVFLVCTTACSCSRTFKSCASAKLQRLTKESVLGDLLRKLDVHADKGDAACAKEARSHWLCSLPAAEQLPPSPPQNAFTHLTAVQLARSRVGKLEDTLAAAKAAVEAEEAKQRVAMVPLMAACDAALLNVQNGRLEMDKLQAAPKRQKIEPALQARRAGLQLLEGDLGVLLLHATRGTREHRIEAVQLLVQRLQHRV